MAFVISDMKRTTSTIQAVFSSEEGADFKSFRQEVYAEGDVSDAEVEQLADKVDTYCRISTTLRRIVPMTTVLHVNGAEVSRREFLPEYYE